MPSRPRPHGGGDTPDPPDRNGPPPRPPGGGDIPDIPEGHRRVLQVAERGRSSADRRVPESGAADGRSDDVELSAIMRRYEQLGETPPPFNIARNDDAFEDKGAHTLLHHGPELALRRSPGAPTVEGRIYGDTPWRHPETRSYKWTDHTTMHREVNRYVQENWETIRSDLALTGRHNGGFDAHHRVGEGYYNKGMHGAGPRQAEYGATSLVIVRMRLALDRDPPQPFIVTAFPSGLL